MALNHIYRSFSYLLLPLLAVSCVFAMATWSPDVQAHKGHAGPMISFIKTKTALKAMLPSGAKIVKRKQPLKDVDIEWAEKTYDVELEEGIYSYYLATDKKSGQTIGAAYVTTVHYRHGDLKLALGIDATKRLTQAAILAVNEKYVVDFEGGVGKGLIEEYAGLSVDESIVRASELASGDKASREFSAAIRDAAVLLVALTR